MKYTFPNEDEHLHNFIVWLFNEVISSGGDGDALWYSRYHDIKDLFPLIEKLKPDGWSADINEKSISVWSSQEGLIITNDEDIYNNAPSWQQILIKW